MGGNAYFAGTSTTWRSTRRPSPDQGAVAFTASGRTVTGPTRPTDPYGQAVCDADPDLYWRLGETNGMAKGLRSQRVQRHLPGRRTLGPGRRRSTGREQGVDLRRQRRLRRLQHPVQQPADLLRGAWFKTTTTRGGKIIGFGAADRHLGQLRPARLHENDGQLIFGAWTGSATPSPRRPPLNDGQWHHVVATQARRRA